MFRKTTFLVMLSLLGSLTLSGCDGDTGGDRAQGVESTPPPASGTPPTTPPPTPLPPPSNGLIESGDITEDDTISTGITGVVIEQNLTLTFNLMVNGTTQIVDLGSSNAGFTLAKLVPNPGDSQGQSWTSYFIKSEDPICRSQADMDDTNNACTSFTEESDPELIDDTAKKVQSEFATGKSVLTQATSDSNGQFENNGDGTWNYTFPFQFADVATLTEVHRSCIQFSFNADVENICVDFVPAEVASATDGISGTSLSDTFYETHNARQIVTEETCNSCHGQLATHGGGRTRTDYCVTCHNPDTNDSNSGNSVDFKQLVHKIHFGRNLPNVVEGKPFTIWGYQNSEHDYSTTGFPQNIKNCGSCHAGNEDILFTQTQMIPEPSAKITEDGHSWVSNPTKQACSSCHEKLFVDNSTLDGDPLPGPNHPGFSDETNCTGCHVDDGAENPNDIQANQIHRDSYTEKALTYAMNIESVINTGPGESPVVTFNVTENGTPIDIKDTAIFDGKIRVGVAWDAASDFDNEGLVGFDALNIEIDAIAESILKAGSDNSFVLDMGLIPETIPEGQDSIAVLMLGHANGPNTTLTEFEDVSPIKSPIEFFASSEAAVTPRRSVVSIDKCNSCHNRFSMVEKGHVNFHAVPSGEPLVCASCHGASLGFDEYADFRYLIHGVHATDIREEPYRGEFSEDIHFPGDIANCDSCHIEGTTQLPLAFNTPIFTGITEQYTTPTAATCSSCHDSAEVQTHMISTGGAKFNEGYDLVQSTTESCALCHGPGEAADVEMVHKR
ncbi:OmcA/MtrC family decaheme c-type cytochrome [Thalassotalea psychrophila]|uniref:OmcA/MtrC family decaheme c-type cytochrome n=1 Tax=Thalassotalea psychrophila TaxID=3065647 RepID=A0ABY9TSR3_9GAMM|nr:OmcA/MtrC family decaheme c-type cytochrome [Colwelliaceae bacterium SQ149]